MKETPFLQDQDNIFDKLKKVAFLRSFKKDYLTIVITNSKIRQYEAGEMIIPEGSYDKWVYVILFGEVKVMKKGEEIARMHDTGDIFGELAMINNETRSASVYATQKSYCLAIDISSFNDLEEVDRNAIYSIIYRIFAELLARRLKETTNELARLQDELSFFQKCSH